MTDREGQRSADGRQLSTRMTARPNSSDTTEKIIAGILQVDGYGGYTALAKRRQQLLLAYRWLDFQRRFYEPAGLLICKRVTN